VIEGNLPHKETRIYFNLLSTVDRKVRAYSQKRDVKDRPNPPQEARYRDPRNRKDGYANYKVGKVYFNFDEVCLMSKGDILPKECKSLSELLDDSDILSDAEKTRQKSLIFYNCAHESEVGLKDQLIEKQVMARDNKL